MEELSLSATDLINNGQGTLSGAVSYTGGAQDGNLPLRGINDGGTTDSTYSPAANPTSFFISRAGFNQTGNTAFATFNLNTTVNTLGYNITSIQSFMGFDNTTLPQLQANQTYTVAVRLVGSVDYTNIATVSYSPFTNATGSFYESHVTITEGSTGVLASGVDSIRFTFLMPAGATAANEGTVIRELDVYGVATVPEPASALLGGLGVLVLLRRRRA